MLNIRLLNTTQLSLLLPTASAKLFFFSAKGPSYCSKNEHVVIMHGDLYSPAVIWHQTHSPRVARVFSCRETQKNSSAWKPGCFDLSAFHFAAHLSAGMRCWVMGGKDRRQEKCSVVGSK